MFVPKIVMILPVWIVTVMGTVVSIVVFVLIIALAVLVRVVELALRYAMVQHVVVVDYAKINVHVLFVQILEIIVKIQRDVVNVQKAANVIILQEQQMELP